ncbi:MAG TPA: hypothetical protein VIY67_01660 [Nitrospiraceae bacterium]
MSDTQSNADELTFSLVRHDPWFRLQRAIGLIPAGGLGIVRRCLIFALVTWLPIAIWALYWRRAFPGVVGEPLLQHFGVHARCLVAIPLLVVAELVGDMVSSHIVPYFVKSGLVQDDMKSQFVHILRSAERLRDGWYAWVSMLVIMLLMVLIGDKDATHLHELNWADEGDAGNLHLGFGGWWYLFVMRPVFIWLLLAWVWRLVVCLVLLWRVSRLNLHLVPTHPDRAGGLGFLEDIPLIFSPVIFASSAVLASRWGHDVFYHDVDVYSFAIPLGVYVAAMLILFLGPLVVFAPILRRLKRQGLLEYGTLVGQHGRLVRRRWISNEQIPDAPLLQAAELGPVIDTVSMYEVVEQIQPAPIGKQALLAVLLPALIPMLPVVAIQIPLKEILIGLLKTLI